MAEKQEHKWKVEDYTEKQEQMLEDTLFDLINIEKRYIKLLYVKLTLEQVKLLHTLNYGLLNSKQMYYKGFPLFVNMIEISNHMDLLNKFRNVLRKRKKMITRVVKTTKRIKICKKNQNKKRN